MAVVVNWFEWIIPQLCIPFIHMGLGWGNHNILLNIWKQTNEYRSCIQRTPQLLRVQTDSYTEACVGQMCVLWKWLCSEEGGTSKSGFGRQLQERLVERHFISNLFNNWRMWQWLWLLPKYKTQEIPYERLAEMPPTGTEPDMLHTCRVSRAGSSICKNFTLELKTTWFSFLMRNRRLHQLNQQYTYLVSVVWLILYGKSYHTISARQHNNTGVTRRRSVVGKIHSVS